MFPLRKRKLIRGCEAHIKAGLGCGADYEAEYTSLYAPFDGVATSFYGSQGGNWIRLWLLDNNKIEFSHLHSYTKLGKVQEGDIIATTGNTGKITTGPHLHIQIFDKNGKRLDPETYKWDNEDMDKIEELKEQVKRLQGESRKLTIEVLEAEAKYRQEIQSNIDTQDHLNGCQKELDKCRSAAKAAKSLLNRIRDFFV